jgi:glucokinase
MKNIYIGIDIGGTNSVVGAVNTSGEIICIKSFKTQNYSTHETYILKLSETIKEVLNEISDYILKGIGIGAPNANYYNGKIENAPNLKWGKDAPIVELLKEYFNVNIKITNDANAAALGEMLFGGAVGMKNFLVVTLGTGLGSGFVANGNLILGHDGFAGELGHINAVRGGRLCGCGNHGCLETYVSATGIRNTVLEMLNNSSFESSLRNFEQNIIDSKLIYENALKGDKLALEVFDFTAKILGEKLADTVVITSPEAIFFFGGLAASGDLLLKPTKYYMEQNLMPIFKNKVKILQSSLMNKNAAVLGAAALVR